MIGQVQSKLNRISRFISQNESLFSIALSLIILVGWGLFVLGFVLTHGVCCGDDAGLALSAKTLAEGSYQKFHFGFDPHLMVILPVTLGIMAFGNAYWIPGLSVLILNSILLLFFIILLKKFNRGFWFIAAILSFLLLNYILMGKHFEQWFAALGEVPAALLLIVAILLYFHRRSPILGFFSGILFTLAFLTKVVTLIAFGAFLISLFLVEFLKFWRKLEKKNLSNFARIFSVIIGFCLPLFGFEYFRHHQLGPEYHLRRWLSNFSYTKEFFSNYQINNLLDGYLEKSAYFSDRFGVPFFSVLIILAIVGWMIKEDQDLKHIYFAILSIFVFYSYWWFYYTYPLGRYYIVPLVLVILSLTMPFLSSRPQTWRWRYLLMLVIWTTFAWQNVMVPIKKLEGSFFEPSARTKALLEVSDLLSRREDQNPILTKHWVTKSDIQYVADEELKFRYFNSVKQYSPPFWIAVTTDFVGLNEIFLKYSASDSAAFKQFLSGCRGLKYYDDYLVGRCE